MPLQYKLPGYAGNALLLLISVIICAQSNMLIGLLLGALAILNLYLVFKLDTFSRPEDILVHQLEMTKVREELLAAQKRVSDLESSIASAPR